MKIICIFALLLWGEIRSNKKAHFRSVLLLVNLDTLLLIMQELEKMNACLMCIRVSIRYRTSGVIQIPYLHYSKGVQAHR